MTTPSANAGAVPVPASAAAHIRDVGEPRLAPDGRAVAWLQSYDGRGDLVFARLIEGRPEPATVLTTDPTIPSSVGHGGGIFAWAPDSASIVFTSTDRALYEIDVASVGTPDSTDASRRLTDADGFAAPHIAGNRVVCMRTRPDSQDIADVLRARDPVAMWPWRLSGNADFCFDPVIAVDPSGAWRVAWHEWDAPAMPWDAGRIVVRDATGMRTVDGGDDVSVAQPQFDPDGVRLAYLCDRDGFMNLWVVDVRDPGAEPSPVVQEDAEHAPPTWSPGNRSFAWSPDGAEIVFTAHRDGRTMLEIVDVDTGDVRVLDDPPGEWSEITWQGGHICGIYSDLVTPPRVMLVDPVSGVRSPVSATQVANTSGYREGAHVTWEAADGEAVHGILVTSAAGSGATDGAGDVSPLLVWIHGGPTGQATFKYNPRLHFFLARGWNVLFVNHRGSTGYGRAYVQAMRSGWGEMDVEDVVAGIRHFVRLGTADPDRIAIMGGSAGGYTVLQTLARHSDLFAAGVSLYGIADLFRLAETTWRFEAHYTDSLVGPLPDAYDLYSERSPITHADRITAPLLVLQGDADEVVPPDQAQMIVDAVRKGGTPVEYHVYEGEGHGWRRADVVIDELGRIEAFLRRYVMRIARL